MTDSYFFTEILSVSPLVNASIEILKILFDWNGITYYIKCLDQFFRVYIFRVTWALPRFSTQ